MELQENETESECIKGLKVKHKDYREKLINFIQAVQSCLTVKVSISPAFYT